jgi:hypothetical protein
MKNSEIKRAIKESRIMQYEIAAQMGKACYEAMALDGNRVIREYLERLGVIDPAEPSLQEIARQMEENYGL